MATFLYPSAPVNLTSAATTSGSNLLTVLATSAGSLGAAIGATLAHANIPGGTTIIGYNSTTQAVMSANATATGSGLTVVATNPAIINIDAVPLVAKTGGDVFDIRGPKLLIDQDSRSGQGSSTTSTHGAITLSATLGGQCEINATKVRLIPFNTGTGNVPAWNTLVTQGGASGKLIGVYASLSDASTATGAAMPASGFIKVKEWNDVAYTSGALTGIGASATGPDVVGWIEVVGDEAGTATVNRLNEFKIRGDYFDLGTTDGNRATTYQIPSSGLLQYHAGVEVETGAGTGVYEFYPCAGSKAALAANIATDALRGKVCWISSAGLLHFGHDGTDSTGGYIVPTGRKIRIANIFLVNCTTAARAANVLPNATLATRYEFATSGGGAIDFDKASISWYLNFAQPYDVTLTNLGVLSNITLSEVASPLTLTNVNVGQEAATSNFAISMTLCFAGGTFTDCDLTRAVLGSSGNYVMTISDCSGFTFNNCKLRGLTKGGHASTGSLIATRLNDSTFNDVVLGGGRAAMATCFRVTWNDTVYYDHPALNTITATFPMYAFDLSSACADVTMDGVSFGGLFMTQPANGIMQVGAAGCTRIKLRNIGTYEAPVSLGSPRRDDQAWTRVTTTATVTSVAHGLAVNDTIYVVVSSSTAAITVAAKTVTTVPTADTFTFAALNAGDASGTLCYFGTKCANVFVLGTGSAALDVKVQRVYAPHTRTNLYTTDNSAKSVTMENIFSDYLNAPLIAMLNGYSKGVSGTPPLTAQTSVYGTHWFNGYVCDVADNQSGVSWSRTTTVVTVTAAGHSLRTGMLINVTATSDSGPVPLGQYTATCLTSSTFTITGVNTGATTGTIDFRVANGRIGLVMNEATAETVDRYTIDSGTPAFTSAGGLVMPTVGDQITFVTPNYLIGQGSTFPIFEAVMTGGTIGNYDIYYALDKNDGNGYGAFRNMYYNRTGAGGTNGSTNVTMTDTTGVEVGDYVWGTNIGFNAKVMSITNGTTVVVDNANRGTVSGTLRFNQLPSESALGPLAGIKMKWRIVTRVASATAITGLYIQTDSSVIGRAATYPLELTTLEITGLKNPSEIRIFDANTTDEIGGSEAITGGTFTATLDAGDYPSVDIAVLSLGYQNTRLTGIDLSSGDVSIPIQQQIDRQYENV